MMLIEEIFTLMSNTSSDKIDRVEREPPPPGGVGREAVERILAVIPTRRKRDLLRVRLVFETAVLIGEG